MSHTIEYGEVKDYTMSEIIASSTEDFKKLEAIVIMRIGTLFFRVSKNNLTEYVTETLTDAVKRYNKL